MNTVEVLCPESGHRIEYALKKRPSGETEILIAICAAVKCSYEDPKGGHRELVVAALGL